MKTINHTVKDPNGIHARPAGILVNTAKKFSSDIKLVSGDSIGDCKRIFTVMGMSLKAGDAFTVEITGEDEAAAAEAIAAVLDSSKI